MLQFHCSVTVASAELPTESGVDKYGVRSLFGPPDGLPKQDICKRRNITRKADRVKFIEAPFGINVMQLDLAENSYLYRLPCIPFVNTY